MGKGGVAGGKEVEGREGKAEDNAVHEERNSY